MESSYHDEIDYERENEIFKRGYDKGYFDGLMENSSFIPYLCNLTDEELLSWKSETSKVLLWSEELMKNGQIQV